jgi:lactoylglutathione lyase
MTFKVSVDHIHLRSADSEQAAKFYIDILNGTEKSRSEVGGRLRVVVELNGLTLFIEQAPPGAGIAPEAPFIGIEHLAVLVDNLEAAATDLRDRNIPFVSEPMEMRPGVRAAFIKAPDNVLIELIQRN